MKENIVKGKVWGDRKTVQKFLLKLHTVFYDCNTNDLIRNDSLDGVHVFLSVNPDDVRNVPIECPLLKEAGK